VVLLVALLPLLLATSSGLPGPVPAAPPAPLSPPAPFAPPTPARVEAFAALYESQSGAIAGYLRHRLGRGGSAQDAEDLTGEVFARAWARLDPAAPVASRTAWLFTTARRLAADHHRRHRPALPLDALSPGQHPAGDAPDGAVIEAETVARLRQGLRAALDGLTARERTVIRLRYGAGLRHREVARAVGTSETNAAKILHRAQRKLRDSLRDVA
jgi:RNA polymerase sigma factor (sigma-70 family)